MPTRVVNHTSGFGSSSTLEDETPVWTVSTTDELFVLVWPFSRHFVIPKCSALVLVPVLKVEIFSQNSTRKPSKCDFVKDFDGVLAKTPVPSRFQTRTENSSQTGFPSLVEIRPWFIALLSYVAQCIKIHFYLYKSLSLS